MGFVISSFALPIVLARTEAVSSKTIARIQHNTNDTLSNSQIKYGAAYLTLGGNVVVYATIFAFFLIADSESSYGGGI